MRPVYTVIASEVSITSDITNGTTKIPGTNINNEGQREDREGSNENENDEAQVQQEDQMQHIPRENEWSYFKTPKELMKDLIKLSDHQEIKYILKSLYDNEEMFYIYLHFCVSNVISKTKWKHNKYDKRYHEYITVSDEALSLLILDNNSRRYLEMSEKIGIIDAKINAKPKYTLVNGAQKFKGKGWNRRGRMRYMEFSLAIENWRESNEDRMNDLSDWILKRYNTTIIDDDTMDTRIERIEQLRKDEEEDRKWKEFLQQTSRLRKKQRVTGLDNDGLTVTSV